MPDSDFKVRVLRDGVQVLAKSLDDCSTLMERVGQYLAQASRAAFTNQSFDGVAWPPRHASESHPSVLTAVQDLTDGPHLSDAAFRPRPALKNSGALSRSIRAVVTGPKTVRLVSDRPYAQLMHAGGPSSLPVTESVKTNLATLLRGSPNLRPALGFLFRVDEVHAEIPARPFLGVAESSRARVAELVDDWVHVQAWKDVTSGSG